MVDEGCLVGEHRRELGAGRDAEVLELSFTAGGCTRSTDQGCDEHRSDLITTTVLRGRRWQLTARYRRECDAG
jgi:hypothetical protein